MYKSRCIYESGYQIFVLTYLYFIQSVSMTLFNIVFLLWLRDNYYLLYLLHLQFCTYISKYQMRIVLLSISGEWVELGRIDFPLEILSLFIYYQNYTVKIIEKEVFLLIYLFNNTWITSVLRKFILNS